jgi:hypothetical protein
MKLIMAIIKDISTKEAIEESIYRNEIVHINFDSEEYFQLLLLCTDYVQCSDYTDFWGTDGKEDWRVQMNANTE